MNNISITKQIMLGLGFMVVFIASVAFGGLWGASQINEKLRLVTEEASPLLADGFKQTLMLGEVSELLLMILAEKESAKIKDLQSQFSTKLQSYFDYITEQEKIDVAYEGVKKAQERSVKAVEGFGLSAVILQDTHKKSLLLNAKIISQEADFSVLADSVNAYLQELSYNKRNKDAAKSARKLLRKMNIYRNIKANLVLAFYLHKHILITLIYLLTFIFHN